MQRFSSGTASVCHRSKDIASGTERVRLPPQHHLWAVYSGVSIQDTSKPVGFIHSAHRQPGAPVPGEGVIDRIPYGPELFVRDDDIAPFAHGRGLALREQLGNDNACGTVRQGLEAEKSMQEIDRIIDAKGALQLIKAAAFLSQNAENGGAAGSR